MARKPGGDREKVFAAIVAAAEIGAPCPTRAELGRIGGGNAQFGRFTCEAFRRDGLIEIEHFGNRRRITILATGKRTGYELPDRSEAVEPSLPRVIRTICQRCGARDHLCGHRPAQLSGALFGVAA